LAKKLLQKGFKSLAMYVDNEYDISVRFRGAECSFRIRTVSLDGKNQYLVLRIDKSIDADVWQKYNLYFTLDAMKDNAEGTLTLSQEYEGKIDPELVSEISNIIKNAEED
jgi:hypothetical protein